VESTTRIPRISSRLGLPLKKDYNIAYPAKREAWDIYLGSIVDAKTKGYLKCGSDADWNEHLAKARCNSPRLNRTLHQ
jgi:hypothetical protein